MNIEQMNKFIKDAIALKTDKEVFAQTLMGAKTFEIRLNDRDYKPADVILLRETEYSGEEMRNGKPLQYTGHQCLVVVRYVLSGYGLKEGWVVMSTDKMISFFDDDKEQTNEQ